MHEEPFDLDTLRARVDAGLTVRLLFFWGHAAPAGKVTKACFSQWYPAAFELEGERFATAEHWMMFQKARLFGDDEAARRVLAAETPAEAKALGRGVRGFDETQWEARRFALVARGNLAKFSAHPALGAFLLSTGDQVLVEASPHDRVWGIGLGEKDPRAADPRTWRGLNLLGFALMDTRARLRAAG